MVGALHLLVQRLFQAQDARLRVDAELVVAVAFVDVVEDAAVELVVGGHDARSDTCALYGSCEKTGALSLTSRTWIRALSK